MKRLFISLATMILATTLGFAQEHASEPAKAEPAKTDPAKAAETKAEEHPAASHEAAAAEGAGEHAAAKEGEEDPHAQFTQSASVKLLARTLGIETKTAYWGSVVLNFAILAGAIFWLSRTRLPQMFRNRTTSIQKGIEEARKASAESATRLAEIEARLSRLDQDIAGMRSQAEGETRVEEERLRAATEEEKRKIVQSAEQEITAAANNARRDLKNLAAELAVALAEKKMSVSEDVDKVLVRDFAANLGAKQDIAKNDAKGRS